MKMRKIIQYLLHCSYSKTLLVNLRHFGFRGLFKPIILVAKRAKIKNFKGHIVFHTKPKIASIRIGFALTPFNGSTVFDCGGEIHFYGKAVFGKGSILSISRGGALVLGNNFRITANSSIICYKKISFGDDCLISWDNLIMDTDFHNVYCHGERYNYDAEIIIDDRVWVCCRCVILKGSHIPADCIVSAGTVISGQYDESNSIIGNNHKILKENISWTR